MGGYHMFSKVMWCGWSIRWVIVVWHSQNCRILGVCVMQTLWASPPLVGQARFFVMSHFGKVGMFVSLIVGLN